MIETAVRRPVAVAMCCLAVLLFGAVSLADLPVDLLPEVATPRLTVVARADALALAPQEVERLVTVPLENQLVTVSGQRRIHSISREGLAVLTVEFPWGTDLDLASLRVREAIDKARPALPRDLQRPAVLRWDPAAEPVLGVAVAGEARLEVLRELVERVVVPRFEQVAGIAGAQVTGGAQREIHVRLEPARLELFGLSVGDVERALEANNASLQSGSVLHGALRYQVRAMGQFRDLEEIAELVLRRDPGATPVRLRDVGSVREATRARTSGALLNGEPAVGVLLYKEAGANTLAAVAAAREALAELRAQYPELTLAVAFDNAVFVRQAIDAAAQNIGFGALLAFAVLFLFLRDPRNPLLIGVAMPISIVATFVLCDFAGITLNIMTLGGLALGAGLLVDNSIVVLENIFRLRQENLGAREAAVRGAEEVAMAVSAATLTTVAVFLPIAYVRGVAGELFAPQAWTVTFALLTSLLVSLTVLPALAARFLRLGAAPPEPPSPARTAAGRWLDALLGGLLWPLHRLSLLVRVLVAPLLDAFAAAYGAFARGYHAALGWCLDHRAVTLGGTAALVAWGAAVGTGLPWELMPRVQTGRFEVILDAPPGTPYGRLEETVRVLDRAARAEPEVRTTFATAGVDPGAVASAAGGGADLSPTRARLSVIMAAAPSARQAEAVRRARERVRQAAAGLAGVRLQIDPRANPLRRALGVAQGGFTVRVAGEQLEPLERAATAIAARLAQVPGLRDVRAGAGEGNPEIRLRVRRDVAAEYGVDVRAVTHTLAGALQGTVPTRLLRFDRSIDIRVRLALAGEEAWGQAAGAGGRDPLAAPGGLGGERSGTQAASATGAKARHADAAAPDRGPDALRALLQQSYPTSKGPVPLRELVEYEIVTGPRQIERLDRVRIVPVTATLEGIELSQAVAGARAALADLTLPAGVRWSLGGEREQVATSFRSLAWALALAAALVYMVMAAQFESLLHPFVILFTLPLGGVGAVTALWLAGLSVNVVALIGVVVLTGIIVNDGIVKVDTINRLRRSGMPLRQAIERGSELRLRPILMTTVTTVCAVLPLALGLGAGAELQRPLAIAILGGEGIGTLLTLLVLPVVYETLAR